MCTYSLSNHFCCCCCCVCCLVCLPIQSQPTGFSWASPSLVKYMKVEKLYMHQYLRQSKCLKSPLVFKKENKRRGCPEDSWHRENIFTHKWKLKASLSSLIHTTTSFTAGIQKGLCQNVSGTTSGISVSSSDHSPTSNIVHSKSCREMEGCWNESLEKCTCSRSSTFDTFCIMRIK